MFLPIIIKDEYIMTKIDTSPEIDECLIKMIVEVHFR
jgi:hypothetical protein